MKKIMGIILCFNILFGTNIPTQTISKYLNTTQKKLVIEEDFTQSVEDEFDDESSLNKQSFLNIDILETSLDRYNRAMTNFNDFFYLNVLIPISTGYSKVIPMPIRQGVSNMFDNLVFPVRFVNNVLQLKFANAVEETSRFVINSSIGLLGFFDPAKDELNLLPHEEDFGQTLGYYGVGSGPHIVLPILGPSNLRDAISIVPDSMLNPTSEYFHDLPSNASNGLILNAVYYINKTSLHLGEYENIRKDAIDLYLFMKDLYEQKREIQIKE